MSEENKSKEDESLLVGVLLKNALLLQRGADFVTAKCPCMQSKQHQSTPAGMWSYQTISCCGGECVMFGEPVKQDDGTITIKICGDDVLKFKRLVDLRGSKPTDIDFLKASDEDVAQWLVDHNIVRF